MRLVAVGSWSLVLTCFAMPLVRYAAMHWGFVDRPAGPLKPQTRAVPYGGGIAIALGVGVALSWARPGLLIVPVAGAIAVFLLGVVDDVRGVSPLPRLIVELLAGSTLVALWPGAASNWLSVVGTGLCCAILGSASMNAFNMTDGSDGLSGTVGVCAAGGLLVGWLLAGETVPAGIAAAFCGSIVGFLIFNWPPARVYLGDSGAYLIGFMLTALCIPALSSWHAVVGVMCIMALFELELIGSIFRRMYGHRRLTEGDRRHIYDVLRMRPGQSASRVDVLYGIIGLVSSGIGVLVWRGAPAILGLAWLAILCILVVLVYRRPWSERMVVT